jgi:hypothetical protein
MTIHGITDTAVSTLCFVIIGVENSPCCRCLHKYFSPLIALREEIGDQFVESSYNLNSSTIYNTTLSIALFLFKLAINGTDTENCLIVLKVTFLKSLSFSGDGVIFNLV